MNQLNVLRITATAQNK